LLRLPSFNGHAMDCPDGVVQVALATNSWLRFLYVDGLFIDALDISIPGGSCDKYR